MSIITRFADDSYSSFLQQYEAFQTSRIVSSPNTYTILQIGVDKGEIECTQSRFVTAKA